MKCLRKAAKSHQVGQITKLCHQRKIKIKFMYRIHRKSTDKIVRPSNENGEEQITS
jgi:hypothetical protein